MARRAKAQRLQRELRTSSGQLELRFTLLRGLRRGAFQRLPRLVRLDNFSRGLRRERWPGRPTAAIAPCDFARYRGSSVAPGDQQYCAGQEIRGSPVSGCDSRLPTEAAGLPVPASCQSPFFLAWDRIG